jgi:hypothetical protein
MEEVSRDRKDKSKSQRVICELRAEVNFWISGEYASKHACELLNHINYIIFNYINYI